MKFYKRYPGDIIKKTSGLTMAQFGAYDRLMDWCYANELPIDPEEVYTITHAMTPADRRDVDRVLAKFFTLTDEGYRQERVEEVIAEALPRIEAARANGSKGGRPTGSGKKPTGLFSETETEPNAKAIQSQTSSPTSKKEAQRKRSAPPPDRPDVVDSQVWLDWLALREKKRAPVTATVLTEANREAEKAGLTLDQFLRVWCARGSQGLEADWLKAHERGPPRRQEEEPAWRREQRERNEAFLGPAAARRVTPKQIDIEAADAIARLVD